MDLTPISPKRSLADDVADRLQEQIVSGQLKLGDRLPVESELMRIFRVGRSTVREAVKKLANLGYLTVQQGRGTFISNVNPSAEPLEHRLKRADYAELADVRHLLEAALAERAVLKRTDEDLAAMRNALLARKEAALANDFDKCMEADIQFHLALAKATHNSILCELYSSLTTRLQEGYRHMYQDVSCFVRSHRHHVVLFEFIVRHDLEGARRTAQEFWRDIHED